MHLSERWNHGEEGAMATQQHPSFLLAEEIPSKIVCTEHQGDDALGPEDVALLTRSAVLHGPITSNAKKPISQPGLK